MFFFLGVGFLVWIKMEDFYDNQNQGLLFLRKQVKKNRIEILFLFILDKKIKRRNIYVNSQGEFDISFNWK